MKIHIEYCIKWNYGPEFDRVSNEIKNWFPQALIEGNTTSPRTGSFEISLNGKLVYSKFDTYKFPTKSEINDFLIV